MARPLLPQRAVLPALLCLIGLLGALSACTPYTYYTVPNSEYDTLSPSKRAEVRRSIRPCTDLTPESSDAALSERCSLSIIEFDDQGEFWKPKQLDDTLDLIEAKSNPDGDEALVVVFVHGWKNDASPANEAERNLGSFKKVLIQLTQEEMRQNKAQDVKRRQVIGIYMAWHGRNSNNFLLRQLSFFARKNAANRVARVSFSHAIHRIVAHTKGTLSETKGNPNSVAVVVGHSFGGLIVENTLLRTLTAETNDFGAYGADLSILINPANEAILARQSVAALHGAPRRELKLDGVDVSQPLIVSVTSVADSATGKIFPPALWLSGIFKNFRKYEEHEPGIRRQKFYYTHTPGHIGEDGALYSHALTCPMESGGVCEEAPETGDEYLQQMEQRMASMTETQETIFPPPAVELGDCEEPIEAEEGGHCIIERLSFVGAATGQLYSMGRDETSPNQTGYWIMRLPATIVPSHSDIFQSELASLLAAFINLKDATVVTSLTDANDELQKAFPGS